MFPTTTAYDYQMPQPLMPQPLMPQSQAGSFGTTKSEQQAQIPPVGQDKVSISEAGKQKASTQDTLSELADKQKVENDAEQAQEKADEKKIQELKDRDQEVRIHEQAHAAVGGQYAGAPSYEFETGPDGKQYAVGGEVSIDVSEEKEPEDTISKMQVVRAAALAPAEPSAQDYKVASQAAQKEQAARAEVAKQSVSGGDENNSRQASQALGNKAELALSQYQYASRPVSQAFSAEA
ncbi:putative metalloprotease CJM1_0395 family protein [Glaciecola siphonariae]|uniref:Metalloprotease CJM1_0395 family protein n=1 Tax=Glaciecola siphonariae TaxID=521012 RepID=A0ABV9LRQ7_9ALTE